METKKLAARKQNKTGGQPGGGGQGPLKEAQLDRMKSSNSIAVLSSKRPFGPAERMSTLLSEK